MSTLNLSEKIDIEANKHIYETFDPAFSESIVKHVMSLLNEVYFRIQLVDFDQPIERNNPNAPVILASNHSGRAIPWDAISFMSGMLKKFNYDHSKVCRTMTAPVLSKLGVMVPYFVPMFWKKCGGIDATFTNFETMMHYPDANVLIYPEGIPGIGKGFNRKYKLQKLSTSFIYMSLKYKTDIVPFATVNAEYINPWMYTFKPVDWVVRKLTGVPFLPIGVLTIMLLLQPWFFYLAFPAKVTFVRGKRIAYSDLTDKNFEELTKGEIERIRDQVHLQMQQELDEAVQQFGKQPFKIMEFFKSAYQNFKYFPFFLPFGWPFLFSEFQMQWEKNKEVNIEYSWKTIVRLLWKRPIIWAYFIPILGWLPIIYWSKRKKHLE